MLDLVLLNYNDADTTLAFVERIKNYNVLSHIVVVDNCSTDDSWERLKELTDEKITVIKTDNNGGYSRGNNAGIKYSLEHFNSDYLIISNPDVFVDENTIIKCLDFLKNHSDIVMVAPRMKNADGSLANSAWSLQSWIKYASTGLKLSKTSHFVSKEQFEKNEYVTCDCLAGSFFVANAKLFSENGLFDESTFLYCEETILGFRNGIGKSAVLSNAFFLHEHSVSINKSVKSEIKKKKILWKSKYYVLSKYYKINFFEKVIVMFIRFLSITETRFSLLKNNIFFKKTKRY